MKLLLLSIAFGIVLGIIGARYMFVGSGVSLILWAAVGLSLGYFSQNYRPAVIHGATYGFTLAFVFMIAGYTGTLSLASRLPFFATLGLIGAICGAGSSLVGHWLRHHTHRPSLPQI